MLKLGIIGCGRQASKLLLAINEIPQIRVTALCDVNEAAFEVFLPNLLNRDSIFLTNSYSKLIDNREVDAVLISTPTYAHLESASYAVMKGKHIFLEKPLGIDIERIDAFIKQALRSKSVVQVGFPYHHAYSFMTTVALLNSSDYGGCKFISVHEHRGPFLGEWFFEKKKSGGTINDKLIHFFDIANTIFSGSRAIEVYAKGSAHTYRPNMKINGITDTPLIIPKPDIIDNASVVVSYSNNEVLNISLNMYQKPPIEGLEMHFVSLNGEFIKWSGEGSDISLTLKDKEGHLSEYEVEDKGDNDSYGVNHPGAKNEFLSFLKNIDNNKEPSANLWKARTAQVIALAAEESVENDRKMDLAKYKNEALFRLAKNRGWMKEIEYKQFTLIPKASKEEATPDFIDVVYKKVRNTFPKKGKESYKKLNQVLLNSVFTAISKDQSVEPLLKKLNVKLLLILPWGKFPIWINKGKLQTFDANNVPDFLTISLTDRGFRSIILNKSITRAYLSGEIKVSGDLKVVQENRLVLERIVKELRKVCLN